MDDGVGRFRRFAKRQEEPMENGGVQSAKRQLAVFRNQFNEGVAKFFVKVESAAARETFSRGAARAIIGIAKLIESALDGTAGQVIGTHTFLRGDTALDFSTDGIGDGESNRRESSRQPEDGEEGSTLR